MKRMVLIVLTLLIALDFTAAMAQRRGGGQAQPWYGEAPSHKAEIYALGGYVWTLSQDAWINDRAGKIDIKDGGGWGIAADINVRPEAQLELLYRRQDSELTFKSGGLTETISDMAVEYYHIGVVTGVQRGNIKPFTAVTLGATRFAFKDYGDEWKFSVIFGLGVKMFLNDRIALRFQGNIPISITNGFVGVGTSGLSLGGTGITQLDLFASVGILFGDS